ncbi:carbohydrate ABC transporter membrane protein 2, CUT1 family [Clostridium amylolyticum]|uniref:Carbohydrate ABC transporter membrane protein 2, CUT1 family n=1 Tax=Clostridium amylolyticum TaxID=1121298 RepID=A0A1M6FSI1_9CLOT|nr:carbohydrate ABC transporter permease [Clostridium amylolyticum]SHJ00603.1 carbohydrate ABC transporter membrane protein 2, CUT1 family [Clostridium amylolyticum]
MKVKNSVGGKIFDTVNIILMILFMAICIYPLLYVLFASLSDPYELMKHRGLLLKPMGFTLNGYSLVFSNPSIMKGFLNTMFYVVAGTGINLLLTCMSAYVLSRKDLLLGKPLMLMVTIPMFFSGGLIPFYLQVQRLGLINTRWAIILPSAISVWNLIVMRTAFKSIPESLIESAKIDGANDFTVLFKIVIPVSKATLAVIGLFYAVSQWNSWFNAMIFLRDRSKYPLQLILREILISNETREMMNMPKGAAQFIKADAYKTLIKYSTVIVSTIPILCVYPFLQKYFVKGVMIGSVKE